MVELAEIGAALVSVPIKLVRLPVVNLLTDIADRASSKALTNADTTYLLRKSLN